MRLFKFSSTTDSVRRDHGSEPQGSPAHSPTIGTPVRNLSPHHKIAVISVALPHANPVERQGLVAELLVVFQLYSLDSMRGVWGWLPLPRQRDMIASRVREALVSRWIFIDEDSQRRALSADRRGLESVVSAAARSADAWSRRSLARFLRHLAPDSASPIILRLLADSEPDVAAEAEATLLHHVIQFGIGDRRDLGFAARIMEAAAEFSTHRRKGVLAAAMLTSDRLAIRKSDRIAMWFDEATRAGGGATRAVIKSGGSWHFAQRAWEWIHKPEWVAACSVRLSAVKTVDEWNGVWNHWHLAINPARLRALRKLNLTASGALPQAAILHELSESAAYGVLRAAFDAAIPAPERELLADAAAMHDSIAVRRAAVRVAPRSATGRFVFDPDPFVARSAILKESPVGEIDAKRMSRDRDVLESIERMHMLGSSKDPMIAGWSAAEIRRHALMSRLGVIARVAQDREQAAAVLADVVVSGSIPDATKSILLARHAGVAREISGEIVNRMIDGECDARLLATCAAAMADAPSEIAIPAIEYACNHSDPRVRANAVEALSRHGGRSSCVQFRDRFTELKRDDHHRVRANALRAWIRGGDVSACIDDLFSMLADVKPLPRLAGTWLLARTIREFETPANIEMWCEVRDRVRMLASQDPDDRVRARAMALKDRIAIAGPGTTSETAFEH
jgi:HEAT repeat protein